MRKPLVPGCQQRFFLIITAWVTVFSAAACMAATEQLDDANVARAIDDQYFLDPAVDANRIDVRVTDGIAELTGIVRDLLAKERATEIAQRVKGVRAVSNRIEVKPPAGRADGAIRRDVEAALLRDPATDSYEVDVAVEDNVVTLSGTVDSWAEKELAATVAKGVDGVADLKNEIQAVYRRDRPDAEIQAEVEKKLHWDVLVDGYLIDVDVDDGEVRLSGTVGSAAEKRRAENLAWNVSGVSTVDESNLEVQWWAEDPNLRKEKYSPRSDAEIEQAIRDGALYDPRVKSFQIEPSVTAGWVTLQGAVDNLEAKKAAEQLARNTVGVTSVTNHLKIRLKNPPSDEKIKAQVEAALTVSPIAKAYEIDVAVDEGWVTLTGSVDSYFEKIEAEDEAAKVTGVVAVRNRLDVAETATYVEPYYYYPWVAYPPAIVVHPDAVDYMVRKEIESELWWSPFVDSDDVKVEVEDGVATLEGTVESWREYHAAADNAYEGGADSVVNRLIVAN